MKGGNKGWGKNFNMTSAELGPIRENEQLEAAALMGIKNVTFLRNSDTALEGVDPIELKYNLTYWVRKFKPNLVLSFSPETEYSQYSYGTMHRDHQTTGKSNICYSEYQKLFCYQGHIAPLCI